MTFSPDFSRLVFPSLVSLISHSEELRFQAARGAPCEFSTLVIPGKLWQFPGYTWSPPPLFHTHLCRVGPTLCIHHTWTEAACRPLESVPPVATAFGKFRQEPCHTYVHRILVALSLHLCIQVEIGPNLCTVSLTVSSGFANHQWGIAGDVWWLWTGMYLFLDCSAKFLLMSKCTYVLM